MTGQAKDERADAGPAGNEQGGEQQGRDEQADSGQASARRAALVAIAQEQWAAALTDLGGRNTLLDYKDRRAGTLDLGAPSAGPDAPPPSPAVRAGRGMPSCSGSPPPRSRPRHFPIKP